MGNKTFEILCVAQHNISNAIKAASLRLNSTKLLKTQYITFPK